MFWDTGVWSIKSFITSVELTQACPRKQSSCTIKYKRCTTGWCRLYTVQWYITVEVSCASTRTHSCVWSPYDMVTSISLSQILQKVKHLVHKLGPCHTSDRDCGEAQGGLWWETENLNVEVTQVVDPFPFQHALLHRRQLLLLLGSLWHYNWYLAFIHGNSAHFTLNCRENFWRQGISGHHEWPNYLVVVWNLKKFQSLVLKTWWMESPWCQTVYSINSEGPGES